MPVVKKTVAIHPMIDMHIRKVWSLLIEKGYDATYSTALNFMLLGAIFEAVKEDGWSEKTRELVWNFIEDQKTIDELNLEDQLLNIQKHITLEVREKLKVKERRVKVTSKEEEEKDS